FSCVPRDIPDSAVCVDRCEYFIICRLWVIIGYSPIVTLFPYTTLFRSLVSGTNSLMVLFLFWQTLRAIPTIVSPKHWVNMWAPRSEEHTSELQSRENLVCRLLLEKINVELFYTNPISLTPKS